MGQHDVKESSDGGARRRFHRHLLADLHALERMLEEGLLESGVRRIGAEQEMFLVDDSGRPKGASLEILETVDDPRVTTELALFNLEINLDPLPFRGDCLSRLASDLEGLLARVREAAARHGARVVLTGILPSLRLSDLGLDNMTPLPRYAALNRATNLMRGGPYDFRIKGVDDLQLSHDSVMLESCNASFQVHFQVDPDDFARLYNASLAFAGPVLAAAANSPLLFGRRLWQETRIALFQQAVDTRKGELSEREMIPRVHFGRRWLDASVVEIFRTDVSRFRALLDTEVDEDPLAKLDRGELPELEALRLHNGTIWRWNRPCYGLTGGRAHLRIENRILPSGPTVADQVANAAFWLGLMNHAAEEGTDFAAELEFEAVKANFIAGARQGLGAQFTWRDERTWPAADLVRDELLPRARDGLLAAGVDAADAERSLAVIGDRVLTSLTGARWILQSLATMKNQGTASERMSALTLATVKRQAEGKPAHLWALADLREAGGWKQHYTRVEQYMTTDLFTVREDDAVDLVANIMDWHRVRHVPVEDDQHRLVGLVSYRSLLRVLTRGARDEDGSPLPVSSIMIRDPISVSPETSTLDAIELVRKYGISCLPVVKEGRLVGVATERDFVAISRGLLLQKLREDEGPEKDRE